MDRNDPVALATFQGFPYLVTRIGCTPLRHIALLPSEWPRERLLDVARRQRDANRLDTCLCLSMEEGVYLSPQGSEFTGSLHVWGIAITGALDLPEPVRETLEFASRRRALDELVESARKQGGYLVGDGLEGGRRATPGDVARLSRRGACGVPVGLERCGDCGRHRGEFLAVKGEGNGDMTPRVVEVFCCCQNHNRCARCGGPLAAGRLSAYEYDLAAGRLLYRAAYCGLDHRCGG
ncbi:MAG TPA: hypothetical protein VFM45_12370 [Anaeromyxobacteraceae bacterium]|nr:hypothetical protein [Anaeromyxobacteraceae bacterium]